MEFELTSEDFEDMRRDPGIHLQPYDVAKSPAPHRFFDSFEKVVAFELLNGGLGIPRHMEWMRFLNFEAWEQSLQIGDDQLLQPDEARGSVAAFRWRHRHQL